MVIGSSLIDRLRYHFGDDWSYTYKAIIDCYDLEVIMCDEKVQEIYFYGQGKEKPCLLISVIKVSKLLCQGCIEY